LLGSFDVVENTKRKNVLEVLDQKTSSFNLIVNVVNVKWYICRVLKFDPSFTRFSLEFKKVENPL
jgi:hypothetical protein